MYGTRLKPKRRASGWVKAVEVLSKSRNKVRQTLAPPFIRASDKYQFNCVYICTYLFILEHGNLDNSLHSLDEFVIVFILNFIFWWKIKLLQSGNILLVILQDGQTVPLLVMVFQVEEVLPHCLVA